MIGLDSPLRFSHRVGLISSHRRKCSTCYDSQTKEERSEEDDQETESITTYSIKFSFVILLVKQAEEKRKQEEQGKHNHGIP